MTFARSFLCTLLFAMVSVSPSFASFQHKSARTTNPSHHAIASRQHHILKPSADECSFLTSDEVAKGLKRQQVKDFNRKIDYDMCICASSVPEFIESDMRGQYIGRLLGNEVARAFLTGLIGEKPWECQYPHHSIARCSPSNPCNFECESPRTLHEGECMCPIGYKMCNDECILESRTCGSSIPHHHKSRGIDSLEEAQRVCGSKEVCGIPGKKAKGVLPFDCVDVKNDEESCGGCLVPHPFCEPDDQPPLGVDCIGIPGVKKAACLDGRCDIKECTKGWELKDGSCKPEGKKRQLPGGLVGLSKVNSAASTANGLLRSGGAPI